MFVISPSSRTSLFWYPIRILNFLLLQITYLLGRPVSEKALLEEIRKLLRKGWRVINNSKWPSKGIRLYSPDYEDKHRYCPIEAVCVELTGPIFHYALPYMAGRRIGLKEEIIVRFMRATDSSEYKEVYPLRQLILKALDRFYDYKALESTAV